MWVVLFHLGATLSLLIFHFSNCCMVYYSHIFNVYYCFAPLFFLFQMLWVWRIHARPYLYPCSSSQQNTETHCDGCYNSLLACSKCTMYELYIVCFVKKSFAGCEEEGCLPCRSPLVKEERGDCSPAKGWPRWASRGTPTARTGDREERSRNIGLGGNGLEGTNCEIRPHRLGIYPSWAQIKRLLRGEESRSAAKPLKWWRKGKLS